MNEQLKYLKASADILGLKHSKQQSLVHVLVCFFKYLKCCALQLIKVSLSGINLIYSSNVK